MTKAKETEITNLTNELQNKKQQISKAKKIIVYLNERKKFLNKTIEAKETEIANLNKTIAEKETKISKN